VRGCSCRNCSTLSQLVAIAAAAAGWLTTGEAVPTLELLRQLLTLVVTELAHAGCSILAGALLYVI
jgi:hypothetical protein